MILTRDQAKQYVRMPNSVTEENFSPYVPDAISKYFPQYLGAALIEKLDKFSEGTFTPAENKEEWNHLLDLIRRSLTRFTLYLAAPSLDVNITESGFLVGNTQQMAPASKERVGSFKESMEDLGYQALDVALGYLDLKKSVFTDWTSSDAYKAFSSGLITSVYQFQRFIDIKNSSLAFYKLRQPMDRVESITIVPILGILLMAALKSEEAKTEPQMDPIRLEALNLARRCVAYITASEEIDAKYKQYTDLFINMLRDYLAANPAKFTELYPNGTPPEAISFSVENTADAKHFHFGG